MINPKPAMSIALSSGPTNNQVCVYGCVRKACACVLLLLHDAVYPVYPAAMPGAVCDSHCCRPFSLPHARHTLHTNNTDL